MHIKKSVSEFLLEYLSTQQIILDYQEFVYQLVTHPNFPSLLALSDTLTFFGVDHKAFRLSASEIPDLPSHFIALINDGKEERLVHISKSGDRYRLENKYYRYEEIAAIYRGIILVANSGAQEEKEAVRKLKMPKYLYLFIIIAVATGAIIQSNNFVSVLLLTTSAVGMILGIEVFRQSIGARSLLSGLCNINLNTDCKSVVKSQKWKLFEYVSFADIAFIFFSVSLLLFATHNPISDHNTILFIYQAGLWLTVPISALSIYYQLKIEKKWCVLCLSILVVLYVQFAAVYSQVMVPLSAVKLFPALIVIAVVTIVSFAILQLKQLLVQLKDLRTLLRSRIRKGRNFSLFKHSLHTQKRYLFPKDENSIYYKAGDDKHELTIITSPFCGHCKDLHENIQRIFHRLSGNMNIHIVYNTDVLSKDVLLFRNLHNVYEQNGFEAYHALYIEYLHNDVIKATKELQLLEQRELSDKYDSILYEERMFCMNNDLLFTPMIFIDGYYYPDEFEREDLSYFLFELIEDPIEIELREPAVLNFSV